jgi:hypothetical protein
VAKTKSEIVVNGVSLSGSTIVGESETEMATTARSEMIKESGERGQRCWLNIITTKINCKKIFKPASNDQWLSPDLSNRARVSSASTALPAASSLPGCGLRSLRFSWPLLLLLAGMLGGCESDNPWAPYTDRVLRVATFVSCFDGISGLPPNGTFYQVLSPQLVADERGVGLLRYYDGRTIRDEAVHFVWRRSWSEGSVPPPYNNVRCAAVWDIPWSTRLNRPYYLEDEPARVAKRYGPLGPVFS